MNCSVSLVESALTLPLLQGRVTAQGLDFQAARSVDDNSRRMLEGAFDVAEMSLATFVRAVGQGEPLVGLPVFPGRRFVQANMFVHRDSGIATAQALAGRRVAVPQYWLTSSVWHRGLLSDEFGVDPQSIDWFTTASERGAAPLPPGVRVTQLEGTSIVQLFEQRRIDAALLPRPLTRELTEAGATNLLADAPATQREYFARTGFFRSCISSPCGAAWRVRSRNWSPRCARPSRPAREDCPDIDADLPGPVGLASNRLNSGALFRLRP